MNSNTARVISQRPGPRRELRHTARVRVDFPVNVLLKGLSHRCRAVDISLNGMSIELTRPLANIAPHFTGTYEIAVSGAKTLKLQARTVWRRGAMQGICFDGLDGDERLAITEMVETALRRLVSDVERLEIAELKDRLGTARRTPVMPAPRPPLRVEGRALLRALMTPR